MTQRLVTLRVRPARIVVLVGSSSCPTDFVLAVRFLSQIWGGRYNPILHVSSDAPDALTAYRLGCNRPDFVFGLNLNDSVWEAAVQKACQPRQYVRLDRAIAENVKSITGLNLIRSDRAIIANCERKASPSAITRPVKTVCVDPSLEWHPYYAAVFGTHPDSLHDKYRDEQVVIESPGAIDLINTHRDFVEGWKESWLDAGCFGLSIHNSLLHVVPPTIVVVKDIIRDLCLFWNVRMACDVDTPSWVIPIPESLVLTDDTLNALRDWLLAFSKYGKKPNYCVMTSASVGEESIARVAAALQSSLADSAIEYVDYMPPGNRLPGVVAFEQTMTWPAELRGQQLTLVPPALKTFSTRSSESWFVDILKDNKTGRAVRDMQLPESTVIPEILNAPCPPSFRRSIVPQFGDGVESINVFCSSNKEVVDLQIPTATEVLEEILREHGYGIIPDEKRSSYLPVIKRFGGLHMAATAMSGQAGQVLEVLRSGRLPTAKRQAEGDDARHQSVLVAQGHALTPREIMGRGKFGKGALGDVHYLDGIQQMLRQESDRVKRIGIARFRRYARRQVPEEMTLQALLEHWAEKAVLARKWKVGPCPRCRRASTVGVINLRESPLCKHCGSRVPMSEWTKIAYALEPSVRHALSEGLAPVAMTGRFLRNMTSKGFFWLPGIKYERATSRGDIDVVACCDGVLVFGECKKHTSTPPDAASWTRTTDQFLNLASVAIECGASLVTLSALVDSFPGEVQHRIESELSGRISFLFLNKADLEKGRRASQPDKEWQTIQLNDLLPSQFPEVKAEKTPGVRRIDLGWAVVEQGTPRKPDNSEP